MAAADEVRTMFPGHSFGVPCTEADIRRAEALLGEPLPPILRELYLAFDGFLGPGRSLPSQGGRRWHPARGARAGLPSGSGGGD